MISSQAKLSLRKETLLFQDIPEHKLNAWDCLVKTSDLFDNPNFSPWYIEALSHYCQTFVVMLWDQEELLAVFPFHKHSNGQKTGVAIGVSDYQGPIYSANASFDAIELYQALGLEDVFFTHIPEIFIPHKKTKDMEISKSYQISLFGGLGVYREHLRQRGSNLWQQMEYKVRKAERHLGKISFVPFLDSHELLAKLISWKRYQFKRTSAYDDFTLPWNKPFIHHLLKVRRESCSGMLSGLFLNGEPLALEMATCSQRTLQTCYGAYNRNYAKYSPGSILLFKLMAYCSSSSIFKIDLGNGEEPYKKHWFTHVNLVAKTSNGNDLKSQAQQKRLFNHLP